MELDETRRREVRAAPMCPKRRCGIRVLRKRGLVVHVAVPTGRQHHGVGGERPDLPRHHVAGDNAARDAVLDDQIEHLVAGVQAHRALGDLAMQRLRRGQLQLLAGLPPRVVVRETCTPPNERVASWPPYSRANGAPIAFIWSITRMLSSPSRKQSASRDRKSRPHGA